MDFLAFSAGGVRFVAFHAAGAVVHQLLIVASEEGDEEKGRTDRLSSRFSLLVLFFFFLGVRLGFVPRGFGLKEERKLRLRRRGGTRECLLSLYEVSNCLVF